MSYVVDTYKEIRVSQGLHQLYYVPYRIPWSESRHVLPSDVDHGHTRVHVNVLLGDVVAGLF
jgi:hypothetical protein